MKRHKVGDVKLTDEALEGKEKLSETQWQEVKSKIKDATDSLSHRDLKLVPNPFLKHPIWQLKVEEENTDHRVYIDVENTKAVILAIWNFDYTHDGNQHWKELKERM